MAGSIELDPDGRHLQIRFPYRADLVEEVKSLPGRRWDKGGKVWRVPAAQVETVIALFLRHGFTLAPEVSGLLAGTQGRAPAAIADTAATTAATPPSAPALAPAPAAATPATGRATDALPISALNERARAALQQGFPEPLWVVGEIADYDKNKDRQHLFFCLLEKRGEHIEAQASVAMFERTAKIVRSRLEALPEPMTLADGLEIRALVRVDLYPRNGRYQLIVEDIDAAFTLGKLALGREAILRELRARNLVDRNKSLPMPVPALRIGVLASLASDGWNDFQKELEAAGIAFVITAYDARVQGELLKPSMLQGLSYFAHRAESFDVLCILRGGGSRTDLAWFDDRDVAIAVAEHPIKILCGIGHQRDCSVLDEICHSSKTPTALAGFLITQVLAARVGLEALSRRLVETTRSALAAEERRLVASAQDLRRLVHGRMVFEQRTLGVATRRLTVGVRHALRRRDVELHRCTAELRSAVRVQLRRHAARLREAGARLLAGASRRIERAEAALGTQQARQRLLDPTAVLKRGYTLARRPGGGILTGVRGLAPGTELVVQFRDGRVLTRVVDAVALEPSIDPTVDRP